MEKPARILVIEDHPDNRELMVNLLEAFGYTPLTASNGEVGLQVARQERPDLIICDVHLPKLDGYGVVREVKRDPALKAIPVVAVTALAMVGDRDKMLAADFDGYLSKPIEPETFIKEVEVFLQPALHTDGPRHFSAAVNVPAAEPAPGPRGTILVVDDTPGNIDFARSTLEPSGYRVLTAGGVQEALERMRETLPDVILCDLHMLLEDGRDLLRIAGDNERFASIPIAIISSSYPLEREVQTFRESGAALFIRRPIEPEALLAQIAGLFAETGPQKGGSREL